MVLVFSGFQRYSRYLRFYLRGHFQFCADIRGFMVARMLDVFRGFTEMIPVHAGILEVVASFCGYNSVILQVFAVFRGSSPFFRFYMYRYPKISCKKNETSKKTIIRPEAVRRKRGNKLIKVQLLNVLLNHGQKLHIWHGFENDKFINLKTVHAYSP